MLEKKVLKLDCMLSDEDEEASEEEKKCAPDLISMGKETGAAGSAEGRQIREGSCSGPGWSERVCREESIRRNAERPADSTRQREGKSRERVCARVCAKNEGQSAASRMPRSDRALASYRSMEVMKRGGARGRPRSEIRVASTGCTSAVAETPASTTGTRSTRTSRRIAMRRIAEGKEPTTSGRTMTKWAARIESQGIRGEPEV